MGDVMAEPYDDCGIDGDDDDLVNVRSVNRMLNRIRMQHVVPMSEAVAKVTRELADHTQAETVVLAKIQGGISTLKWIGYIVVALLALDGVPNASKVLLRIMGGG